MNEPDFCKEFTALLFSLLRSETPEEARKYVRLLQELEEQADKKGKAVFIGIQLILK